MIEGEPQSLDEFPLLALGTALLRQRWRLVRWAIFGAVVAAIVTSVRPVLYTSTTTFVPQNNSDANRGGLASLAGQFGLALPTANQSASPDFYVMLLKSRPLLDKIVRDTLTVAEMDGKRVAVLDLFKVKGESSDIRDDKGIDELVKHVGAAVSKTSGVVELSVQTRWPSVSFAIASALVGEVNEFNLRTKQEQAAAERKFIENRLALAASDLHAAEDGLAVFLRDNRQYSGSPDLAVQRDRLQRVVTLRQEVFTSLTQSYEESRIREVRDTPVISIVEPPTLPVRPASRFRVLGTLLGAMVGVLVGSLLAFVSEALLRLRTGGSGEANIFFATLDDATREVKARIGRLRGRVGPGSLS